MSGPGLERQFPESPEMQQQHGDQQLSDVTRQTFSQEFISELANTSSLSAGRNNSPVLNQNLNLPPLEVGNFTDAGKANWTIAIDLTADLALPDGTEVGAQSQLMKLQNLVDASMGNPDAALVVQVADNPSGQLPFDGTGQQQNVQLDRYLIKDGQLTTMETADSQGMQANQTNLLKLANAVAPSDHVGMVIMAHGSGADGLVGGTGRETLTQLSDAIRTGLAGTGHERLDVLDFDACSMASAAALDQVSNAADYVVASELRERASKNFAAQNLNATLTDLLQNSQVTPADLARTFVEKANEGVTPEVLPGDPFKHVGADVIAAYNTSQYGQFSQALNELGIKLSDASQDATARREIEKLFDQTSLLPGDANFVERRDLRQFVQAVKAAAESGALPDDGGEISRAATQVLDAQKNMTGDLNVSNTGGYDQLGGMYVFLPVQAVRDGQADGPGGLHWLDQRSAKSDFGKKDDIIENLGIASHDILARLSSSSSRQQFQPVVAAVDQVKNAQTEADFQTAMKSLNTIVKGLLGTNVEQELQDYLVQREDVPMADRWNDFTHSFAPAQ